MGTTFAVAEIALASAPAFAEIDNAKADQLFKEALALRSVKAIQACAKFAEALTYNLQAIGTRLNVARCDEDQGRIASAADKYADVVDRAREQKLDEFRAEAETRLAIVLPVIPHDLVRCPTTLRRQGRGRRSQRRDRQADATRDRSR